MDSSDKQFNYKYNWRRPANIEFFERKEKNTVINQLCELRVAGGASRIFKLKTLALYANKRFGNKHFKYELFPHDRPSVTEYKSFLLRNAGNDFKQLYMRDAIIQRVMVSHVDLDWQAWRPTIVYINGAYKGILNLRERANEVNILTHYGIEDIDLIENWNSLKEGTMDNAIAFRTFYRQDGHSMVEYEELMDCGEFANLMIMNLYFNNQDFPAHNIVMWRPRTEGGRWRWIAKDTDFGLGLYRDADYNSIAWLHDPNYDKFKANTPAATLLFRQLMTDADFKRMFIDRCAVYMGEFLNEATIHSVWDPMYQEIKAEFPYHCLAIGRKDNYTEELSKAQEWLSKRSQYFANHLAEFYNLGTPTPLTINHDTDIAEEESPNISFNGIKLSKGSFDGMYFQGREITLSAQTEDETQTFIWEIKSNGANGEVSKEEITGNECSFQMPQCDSLSITLARATTDIRSITGTYHISTDSCWYSISGQRFDHKPTKSGLYIHHGKKVLITQ